MNIQELNNNDKIKINLFGKEKEVRVFATGDSKYDENGNYKNYDYKLNDKEIECLNWFINNVNIENYNKI